MAHLYSHKRFGWQIKYRIYFPDGTNKQKYRFCSNKPRAQFFLHEIEKFEYASFHGTLTRELLIYSLNRKIISPQEGERLLGKPVIIPALGELAETFLERSRIECRPRVHAANKSRISHLVDFFGGSCLASDIMLDRIEVYRGHRLRLISAITINKEVNKLAQLLDIAIENGALVENPARKIHRLRDTRERKPRSLTSEEIGKLLATAQTEKGLFRGMAYPIILTYLYTGMRREELVWLEWEDVDFERRRITIQAKDGFATKTGKARTVGIALKLAAHLWALPREGRYVFGGTRPLLRGDGITHAFRKLADIAGLSKTITLHSLRHTYITHLIGANVNPRRVQELAGHRDMSTTWRYAHALPSDGIEEDRLDF